TDAHHRDYLRRCIRIHAAEFGPAWKQVEIESQEVVEGLLRDFGSRGHSAMKSMPVVKSNRLRRLRGALLHEPIRCVRIGPVHPSGFRPEGKYGFVVDLAELGVFARSDLDYQGLAGTAGVSRLELFEDGKPLGPPHQMHDVIRNKGGGAFSHWGTG